MRPIAPAAPAMDEKQLLAILGPVIEKIAADEIPQDVEPERIWALRQAQKADFFWRAIQNISPKRTAGGEIMYSSIGAPLNGKGGDGSGSDYLFDYVINIYRGYGRKFIATLGSRMPNVKAVPDDPDDEAVIEVTRMADIAASILRSKWDMETRHMELCLQLYKSTAFIYTPYVSDGEKWGKRTEEKIESRQVANGPETWRCSSCGQEYKDQQSAMQDPHPDMLGHIPAPTIDVPEPVGVAHYDNGMVEYHICNIFTVVVPFWSKDLDDAPWLSYEYDEYKGKLIKMFPDLRKSAQDSPGTYDTAGAQLAKEARDAAASPIGVPNPHRESRWAYRRLWLKNFMYETVEEDDKRKLLYEYFPEGIQAVMVNGKVKKLINENLIDVWTACKPETSEYIYADGIGHDMMPVQELKNDTTNLASRTLQGGIGMNFCDPRAIDPEQWDFRTRVPNEVIGVLPSFGGNLKEAFYQVPPTVMSEQLIPWMGGLENDGRVMIGTTEAIYGGQVAEQTAHEAELRKNAALQQLGTTYMFIRKADEKAYQNGVKQLARYGSGVMKGSKKNDTGYESLILEISKLTETGWHFESEEAFPMTHAERRAYLLQVLADPNMAQAMGIMHPRNVAKNQELLGFTDYYADGVDDHYKAQEVIVELLKGKPIRAPKPDGGVDVQPSIPIDDFDNHQAMTQEAAAWMKSATGRREQKENVDGFANVAAWGLQHMNAAAPPKDPLPPPRLSIAAKLGDLMPDQAHKVLEDYGVDVPDASPAAGLLPPGEPMPPSSSVPGAKNGAPAPPDLSKLPGLPGAPPAPISPQSKAPTFPLQ